MKPKDVERERLAAECLKRSKSGECRMECERNQKQGFCIEAWKAAKE